MKKLIFYLAILVLFVSCELDNYGNFSCINGYVRYKDTYEPIPNVRVALQPDSQNTFTDEEGFFEFIDLKIDQIYTVTYEAKAGLYESDTSQATPTIAGKCEDASITLSRDDKQDREK